LARRAIVSGLAQPGDRLQRFSDAVRVPSSDHRRRATGQQTEPITAIVVELLPPLLGVAPSYRVRYECLIATNESVRNVREWATPVTFGGLTGLCRPIAAEKDTV